MPMTQELVVFDVLLLVDLGALPGQAVLESMLEGSMLSLVM